MANNNEIEQTSANLMAKSKNYHEASSTNVPLKLSEKKQFIESIKNKTFLPEENYSSKHYEISNSDSPGFILTESMTVTFPDAIGYPYFRQPPRFVYGFDVEKKSIDLRVCFHFKLKKNNQYIFGADSDGFPPVQCHFQNFADLASFLVHLEYHFSNHGINKLVAVYFDQFLKENLSGSQIKFLYKHRPNDIPVKNINHLDYFDYIKHFKSDEEYLLEIDTLIRYDIYGTNLPFDGWWKDSENYVPIILNFLQDTNKVVKKWLDDPKYLMEQYSAIEEDEGARDFFVSTVIAFTLKTLVPPDEGEDPVMVTVPKRKDLRFQIGSYQEQEVKPVVENDIKIFFPPQKGDVEPAIHSFDLNTTLGHVDGLIHIENYEVVSFKKYYAPEENPIDVKGIVHSGPRKLVEKTEKLATQQKHSETKGFETIENLYNSLLHPLTLVYLRDHSSGREGMVPLIYLKLLADRREKEELFRIINITLTIITVLLTFYGVYASLAAVTLIGRIFWFSVEVVNVTDFTLIALSNKYPKNESLAYFSKNFNTLTLGLNAAILSGLTLRAIFKHSQKILYRLTAGEVSTKTLDVADNLLNQALKKIDQFGIKKGTVVKIAPTEIKSEFKSILNESFIDRLNNSGAVFASGIRRTEDGSEIAVKVLIYEGEIIAHGTPKELRATLNPYKGLPQAKLDKTLEGLSIKAGKAKRLQEMIDNKWWDVRKKKAFGQHELETAVEIEFREGITLRPAVTGEAGDFIGSNGKSYDPSGLPSAQGAVDAYSRKPVKWIKDFLDSIDYHFKKFTQNPPLDKYILDLRHADKYPKKVKEEILRHLKMNHSKYLNNKAKFEIYE